MNPTHDIRIRVVDVASERAGRPDSTWIRADQAPEAIEADIDDWLAESPFDISDGAAVRGYEGLGDVIFSGDESLAQISQLALLIRQYGPVFIEVFKQVYAGQARHVAEAAALFTEHYIGTFENLSDWGEQFADRMDLACDDLIGPHVDWAAFARDSEGDHFSIITDANRRIHVFGV